jgi:hypothetical protein
MMRYMGYQARVVDFDIGLIVNEYVLMFWITLHAHLASITCVSMLPVACGHHSTIYGGQRHMLAQ